MRHRQPMAAVAALALLPALAACNGGSTTATTSAGSAVATSGTSSASAVATSTSASPTPTATAAMTPAGLSAMWADYDRRNNAAIAGSRTNPDLWAAVDAGLALQADLFQTAVSKATKAPADKPFTHAPGALYAEATNGYPRRFLTVSVASRPELRDPVLYSFVQRAAGSPWLVDGMSAPVKGAPFPKPVAARPLTDTERARVVTMATQVREHLRTGAPAPLVPGTDIGGFKALAGKELAPGPNRSSSRVVAFAGTAPTAADLGQAVSAGPAEGGVVAHLAYRIDFTVRLKDGKPLMSYNPPESAVYGRKASSSLLNSVAVWVTLHVPPAGKAQVIGQSIARIPKPGVTL